MVAKSITSSWLACIPPRSVLITDASSGIGAAFARRYGRPGIHLALGGTPLAVSPRQPQPAAAGAYVAARIVDVTDRRAMAIWISSVDRDAPLDRVIANRGSAGRHPDGPERTRAILAVSLAG